MSITCLSARLALPPLMSGQNMKHVLELEPGRADNDCNVALQGVLSVHCAGQGWQGGRVAGWQGGRVAG